MGNAIAGAWPRALARWPFQPESYRVTLVQFRFARSHCLAEAHLADPFFSRANPYIGNADAQGHCGAALREHRNVTIVLIPGAPHTLLNVPQARTVVGAWLHTTVG